MTADERDERLRTEANVWLATMRPDGRPHVSPIWFVWVRLESGRGPVARWLYG